MTKHDEHKNINPKIVGQEINRARIQSFKQGYAQAFEDVKKRIETHHYSNTDHIKWLKQQIAKLGKDKTK